MTIGVFDSGHGGLTVLAALRRYLPEQHFIYLGDHAAAPYGERSPEEVYALTQQGIDWLFDQGCHLVVVACNTACALSLRKLQQDWLPKRAPDRRVLGVLVPAIEAITRQPWHLGEARPISSPLPASVAVFATRRTVESGAYPYEIGLRAPGIAVFQQACPGLAGKIEAGASQGELHRMVAEDVTALLGAMQGQPPELAVLACTHYPLVAEAFAKTLPPNTELLDQPRLVAKSLGAYLQRHPTIGSRGNTGDGRGQLLCFTTGEALTVNRKATAFTGKDWAFQSVDIEIADRQFA